MGKKNVKSVFDLKDLVVDTFVSNPQLLNHMFIECGYNELVFIRNCGAYMGGVFGIVQVLIWEFYPAGWMLPTFGFFAGILSNWLALKMIFEPVEPRRCCCFIIQGLFLKRQAEVAKVYAHVVSQNVLYAKNIIRGILRGSLSKQIFEMLLKHIAVATDRQIGAFKPMVDLISSVDRVNAIKFEVSEQVIKMLPDTMIHVEKYLDNAMDLEALLR